MAKPHVVIAGCGFGGLTAVSNLRRLLGDSVRITAIDSNDRFDYHASLPGVVSGRVKVDAITVPLSPALARKGAQFVQGRITGIDWNKRNVSYAPPNGKKSRLQSIPYDYLVMALGSQTAYYSIPGAQENAFEFKSYADAVALREHVETLLSSCPRSKKDDGQSRIVVIGGGLTGVELAADLQDLVDELRARCQLPAGQAELVLVHRSPHLHPTLADGAGEFSERYLQKRGVRLVLGAAVKAVEKNAVLLDDGSRILAQTIIWCAGIQPVEVAGESSPPPTPKVTKRANAKPAASAPTFDPKCGLTLNPYLQSIGSPRVFAVGDCASCSTTESHPVLSYLRAVEQADFVSHNLACEIRAHAHRKMIYIPRSFPALISLGGGMGLLSFNGLWAPGRRWLIAKKLLEKVHLYRYRYGLDLLEFFDELFVSLVELAAYTQVRARD